jgi:hypothetical protein
MVRKWSTVPIFFSYNPLYPNSPVGESRSRQNLTCRTARACAATLSAHHLKNGKNQGHFSRTLAKGPATTTWIWDLHADAHDFDSHTTNLEEISRKVFSAHFGQLAKNLTCRTARASPAAAAASSHAASVTESDLP